MIKPFLLNILFLFFGVSLVSAQEDSLDMLMVYELDTISTPGYSQKYKLDDTVSFFVIEGNKVYLAGNYSVRSFKKKGKVGRLKFTTNEYGLDDAFFYMVSRGLGKGSITIKYKELPNDRIEIHAVSAFASFDRIFVGHKVALQDLDRSVFTKARKPNSK